MSAWFRASIALNLILGAAFLWTRPAAKLRASLDGAAEHAAAVEEFRAMPSSEESVVFLGDSLTAAAPFCELASGFLNRGLPGDDVAGVLGRLDEVIARQPRQLWLMIGTNDLKRGADPEAVASSVATMVDRVGKESPNTEIFVQSVLPTRPRDRGSAPMEAVGAVNELLRQLADRPRVTFIDLTKRFLDDEGLLEQRLTTDGVHLSPAGYQVWFDAIEGRLITP